MKKLYLHLGFHKTASSSFQSTCKANVKTLEDKGFLYPLFNSKHIDLVDIANHSIPFYSMFSGIPEQYHVNICRRVEDFSSLNAEYFYYLKECLSSGLDVIISGEDISILSLESLARMLLFISRFEYEIVPIVIVRSPYEFHCSVVQEHVKGGADISIVDFLSQKKKIQKLQQVFSDVRFIPFKLTLAHDFGPAGFMFDVLGISPEELNIKSVNEGISNLNVRAQLELNKIQPRILSGKLNHRWDDITRKGKDVFKQKFLLSRSEYELIKDSLDEENAFFEKCLGADFVDKSIQLLPDEVLYAEIAQYLQQIENNKNSDKDADFLRDIALKYDSQTPLSLEDAHYLMGLAHKVRPHGPVIKKKLDHYAAELKK